VSAVERRDVGDVTYVTVRYWAALRAAAGTAAERVTPGRLDEVLAGLAANHGDLPRFAQVLAICSVLVDEQQMGTRDPAEVMVGPGSVVDLLPPFAGGSR
jgi:molybdopterin converting factor small subunit